MTDSDPTAARLDAITTRTIGRPFNECSTRDLRGILDSLNEEATTITAGNDQCEAALAEAARCGCPVVAPVRADGTKDISRARVLHRDGAGKKGGVTENPGRRFGCTGPDLPGAI